jgi:hypothetical protein
MKPLPLEPDTAQIKTFVEAMFRHVGRGNFVAFRSFVDDGSNQVVHNESAKLVAGQDLSFLIEVAEDYARRAANEPRPVVFCPPLATFCKSKSAKEVDLVEGVALSVECDQKPATALFELEGLLGPATVIVESGGVWTDPKTGETEPKLHLHWRLEKPATGKDLGRLKSARSIASELVGGDPSNKTIVHPIRWPGSWHRKGEPRLCRIRTLRPEVEITLDDAMKALPAPSGKTAAGNGTTGTTGESKDWAGLFSKVLSGKEFHPAITPLAMKFQRAGMHDGAVTNVLRALMEASSGPQDARWHSRYDDDVPHAVKTGREKIGHAENNPDEPAGIKILSSAEFIRDYIPPDYLIEGLLQRQFFYSLTGKTGGGKTAIALLFAAYVALEKVMDGRQFEGGRVLYLAGENPIDVQQRWIAMAQQFDFDGDTIPVHFIRGVFKVSEMREKISDEVEKLGGVSLIIIDTSAAYYEGDDENSNVQMGEYARMQRNLVSLPGGPTVLALCHPVKNAPDDNFLPRGGGAYLNETDGNMTVRNNDGVAELHWQGKFRGADFAPISFRLRKVFHERLKDSKGRLISTVVASHLSETAEKELRTVTINNEDTVLRILADTPWLSIVDIAMRAGWLNKDGKPNKSAAFRIVRSLKADKLVKQTRRGPELTDAGRAAIKSKEATK